MSTDATPAAAPSTPPAATPVQPAPVVAQAPVVVPLGLPTPLVPKSPAPAPVHPKGTPGVFITVADGVIQQIVSVGEDAVNVYVAEQTDPTRSHFLPVIQIGEAIFQALLDRFGGLAKQQVVKPVAAPVAGAAPAAAAKKPAPHMVSVPQTPK